MHGALMYLVTATLVVQTAVAQPERRSASDGRPAATLGDMERICQAGRRSACEDAERLRAQLNERMRVQTNSADTGSEAAGAALPDASDVSRGARQPDPQR